MVGLLRSAAPLVFPESMAVHDKNKLTFMLSVKDFRKEAEKILPPHVFDFIDGGAMDEHAMIRNQRARDDAVFTPRVLCNITSPDLSKEFFGHKASSPLIIAPTAYQKLVHPEGERAMLCAANTMNTIFTVGMFSTTDYEILAREAQVPLWAQMYFLKDSSVNDAYIRKVTELGYQALVVTVDAPVYGKREREIKSPLHFPSMLSFDHLISLGLPFGACLKDTTHFSSLINPSISWNDINDLRSKTSLPIILKGILHPKDTEIALTMPHVKGIIVSNHGGRQFDGAPAAMDVLEQHRRLAPKNFHIFVDGAMERGPLFLKSLALGANGILLGRSMLWALAVGGEEGVTHLLRIMMKELSESLHLCGCPSVHDVTF